MPTHMVSTTCSDACRTPVSFHPGLDTFTDRLSLGRCGPRLCFTFKGHSPLWTGHRSDYRIVSSHSRLTGGCYLEAVQRSKPRYPSRIQLSLTRFGSQGSLSIALYALRVLDALFNLISSPACPPEVRGQYRSVAGTCIARDKV